MRWLRQDCFLVDGARGLGHRVCSKLNVGMQLALQPSGV